MRLRDLVVEDFQRSQLNEVKSPLQWTGGKFFLADWIVSLMPKHEVYVEPFFGAGWVFFTKHRSKVEVINDIDDRVYALFKVLSDEELFQEFVEKIWFVGACERLYYEMLEKLRSGGLGLVDKAVAFFYVNRFALSGNLDESFLIWRKKNKADFYEGVKDRLLAIHKRLKGVLVLNQDWKDVVRKYDGSNVVSYLDPPYILGTRSGSEGIYAYEMSNEEHEELVDICLRLKGKVILSGYQNEIYRRLEESGWIRLDREICLRSVAVGQGQEKPRRVESVWLNYRVGRWLV
jgi:DNA adenine methylase